MSVRIILALVIGPDCDECGNMSSLSCSDLDSTPHIIEIVTPNSSINVSSQSLTEDNINHESAVLISPILDDSYETTTEVSIIDNNTAPEECLQSLRTKNADRKLGYLRT